MNQEFPSLKAAAESKEIDGVSKVTSFAVDPRIIEVEEGFNARPLDMEHVARLSLAYRNGAIFPDLDVRVDAGRIIAVDGHHRRAAALDAIANGAEVRALGCKQFRGNDADRVAHLITSAGGKPLTPLQMGLQFRKLIGFGWTEKQIAGRMGQENIQYVRDLITLAESNSDVHRAINDGEISSTTALAVVKKHGERAGKVIAEKSAEAKASGAKRVTARHISPRATTQPTTELLALCRQIPDDIIGKWADKVRALVAASANKEQSK